jgi:proline dehydrogenase
VRLFDRAVVRVLPAVPRSVVRRVASPYIAGSTLDDARRVVAGLNAEGMRATVDVLGEEIARPDEAEAIARAYRDALAAITEDGLDANISIKLTGFGLKLDEGLCRELVFGLVADAHQRGTFVRLDMEDSSTTDATLELYRALRAAGHDGVGVVLQAALRRTLSDVEELAALEPSVRLCKGIYVEPREVAWKGYETVRGAFMAALEKLLARGVYTGIATHDELLVAAGVALADRLRVPRERHEYQMLLGVEDELRRILVARGHRLRVYVPYGGDWYLYSQRRMRENPAIAGHVMRAFLGLRPKAE